MVSGSGTTRKRAVHDGPFSLFWVLVLLLPLVLEAQEPQPLATEDPIHWALASVVGTGWYHVAAGREAFIVSLSPRQVLRETSSAACPERGSGLWINYDAAVGLYEIDSVPGFLDQDNLGTISFTPGIEAEVPVTDGWTLRAYANLGWGTAVSDGDSAWIWYAGLRSRYRLGTATSDWYLLNGLYYAGFDPDTGSTQDMTGLFAGLEYAHGLGRRSGYRLFWHAGYTFLEDSVPLVVRDNQALSIGDTVELGLAVGRVDEPFRLWFLEFDRLGLKYNVDTDGEFKSISLTVGSWFDS